MPFHTASRSLLGIVFVIFISISAAFGQVDDDIITVDSSVVLVNVTVTSKDGKAMNGLGESQFTVLEDGVPQKIDLFTAESTPFAAVILIDTSGSMEQRVSIARGAAIKFLEGLRQQDVAAVYHFNSKVIEVRDFSSSHDMPDMFFDLKADGDTVLNDAIYKAAGMLAKRPEKRRAIIVLSDGEDTSSGKSDDKALKAASDAGATIYTVDVSSADTPRTERARMQGALKKFAEKSGGTFVATPGGPELRAAFSKIVEELGNQYTLAYQPKDEKKDGKFHTIEVRISRPNLNIRTRKGYTAPKPAGK